MKVKVPGIKEMYLHSCKGTNLQKLAWDMWKGTPRPWSYAIHQGLCYSLQLQDLWWPDSTACSLGHMQKNGTLVQYLREQLWWIRLLLRESCVWTLWAGWEGARISQPARRTAHSRTHLSLGCSCRVGGKWTNAMSKRNLKDVSCYDEPQGRRMKGHLCTGDTSNTKKWLATKGLGYLEAVK